MVEYHRKRKAQAYRFNQSVLGTWFEQGKYITRPVKSVATP